MIKKILVLILASIHRLKSIKDVKTFKLKTKCLVKIKKLTKCVYLMILKMRITQSSLAINKYKYKTIIKYN